MRAKKWFTYWVQGIVFFQMGLMSALSEDKAVLEALIKIRDEQPYIHLSDYVYNRTPRRFTSKMDEGVWKNLLKVHDATFSVESLLELCKHEDAKIRTLALFGLVHKEDRRVVPVLISMLDDEAESFPHSTQYLESLPIMLDQAQGVNEKPHPTMPTKLNQIVHMYLKLLGEQKLTMSEEEGQRWLKDRVQNKDWLAWYYYRYQRITHATSPMSEDSKQRLLPFLKELEALPETTQAWFYLYIADEIFMQDGYWKDDFASEEVMIRKVKVLPAASLLEFLQTGQRVELEDPSLDSGQPGRRFLTRYARHFFDPSHADMFKVINLYGAGAEADPQRADEMLLSGLVHYENDSWDVARLFAACASVGNKLVQDKAVKWFYESPNEARSSSLQSIFINEFTARAPKEWRKVFRDLVEHPKSEGLKALDALYLVLAYERLSGEKLQDVPLHQEHAIGLIKMMRERLAK